MGGWDRRGALAERIIFILRVENHESMRMTLQLILFNELSATVEVPVIESIHRGRQ